MSSGGLYHGLMIFVFYAIGMSLPIILITVLVAKANDLILGKMVQATGILNKISGIILVIVGFILQWSHFCFLDFEKAIRSDLGVWIETPFWTMNHR